MALNNNVMVVLVSLLAHECIAQKLSPRFLGYTSVKMNNVDIGGTKEYIDVNKTRYEVRVFRGIPYAEPPTGDRRFKPPVKKASFKASFNATEFGAACMQNPAVRLGTSSDVLAHRNISEDCLFLNIYAPMGDSKKAVMVYLHGGAWLFGSGMRHDGSAFAGYGDVIVVTLNFRLGPFGYLSTGNENARGNYGIMDMLLALDWVRENIGYFGGDADAVTVFGGSAGSFGAQLLAMLQTPSNDQLPIKRCISSSGSIITSSPLSKSFQENPRVYANKLATQVGCNNTENKFLSDTKLLIECLRGKSADSLLKASNFFLSDNPHFELLWAPNKDGELIKENPLDLFTKDIDVFKSFKSVDLLIGSNSADGDIILGLMAQKGRLPALGVSGPNFYVTKSQLKVLIPGIFDNWPNKDGIARAAQHEFVPFGDMTGRQGRDILVDVFSDENFIMPAIAAARAHERLEPTSRTFMYFFDYVHSFAKSKFRPEKAGHINEQASLFGPFLQDPANMPFNLTDVDDQVSLAMITYWTNFAKYGNPSGDGNKTNKTPSPFPEWPEFTRDNQLYLNIAANTTSPTLLTVKKDLREKAASFWLTYVPFLANQTCPWHDVMTCSKTTCQPIMDQYIGYLRLTVRQTHTTIIVLAVTLGVFGLCSILLLCVYFRLRKRLLSENKYAVK